MSEFTYKKDGFKEYLTFSQDQSFLLENGKTFGPITICFETYGQLNKDKNNCIFITHALTGDSHVARHSKADIPGWWEDFVGPDKIFDTNKYFVVCSNVLGGCSGSTGPSSINSETNEPYGINFPIITVKDIVNAQREIFKYLNIDHIAAVVGGSMGGMQSLQWAVSYPDFMDGIINLAASLNLSAEAVGINHIMRKSIMWDPNWNNGNYYSSNFPANGLSIARMIAMLTYQTRDLIDKKFGRKVKNNIDDFFKSFDAEFEIDSYLSYQGEKLVQRFDANSYLYFTRAMDIFDLRSEYGSYEKALSRIKAKFLLVAISSDTLFNINELRRTKDILKLSGVDLDYAEIQSNYGHDSFLVEVDKYEDCISNFFETLNDKINYRVTWKEFEYSTGNI